MKTETMPEFEIQGPDENGHVWLCSVNGREDWCHNLGKTEGVAEAFCQWLGSIDYEECGQATFAK